jgi:AcrR family transcriptional regulator
VTTHTPRARLVRNSRVLRRADEIADAAARVFAERGYHGTTTQAIADVLGMRQASLYYYFPSKEAALEEVCAARQADASHRFASRADRDHARLRQGVH